MLAPPHDRHFHRSIRIYLFFFSASRMTFLTIFCSSIRKARTTRSLTQLAQRLPPYARCTVFFGREIWAYSRGRRAGICGQKQVSTHSAATTATVVRCRGRVQGRRGRVPRTPANLLPQSPHFGLVPFFFMCKYLCSPPGVLMTRTLLETVLYGIRLR